MTRERAEDVAVDTNDPAPMEVAPEATRLRPDVQAHLHQIRPGDANGLANLLALYPDQRAAILAAAAQRLGNSTVQHALAMEDFREVNGDGPKAEGHAPSAANAAGAMDDFRAVNEAPAAAPTSDIPGRGHAPSGANAAGAMADFRDVNGDTTPAPEQESAWVGGARAYNGKHTELVTEFNALTQGSCSAPDGTLDPNKVAAWQAAHGCAPDGRVGPHTVAAAKQADPAQSNVAPEPQAGAPEIK